MTTLKLGTSNKQLAIIYFKWLIVMVLFAFCQLFIVEFLFPAASFSINFYPVKA